MHSAQHLYIPIPSRNKEKFFFRSQFQDFLQAELRLSALITITNSLTEYEH